MSQINHRICSNCSQPFWTRRRDAKYCTATCRKAASRQQEAPIKKIRLEPDKGYYPYLEIEFTINLNGRNYRKAGVARAVQIDYEHEDELRHSQIPLQQVKSIAMTAFPKE